eukprot:m.47231 g.47231  ORF g.47231 m.47231 type:complete len:418 (+) comp8833_c0_seq1:115-1368(+)
MASAAHTPGTSDHVGRRAVIHGLQSKPELNGSVVVVLPGLKVTGIPKPLSLRPANLKWLRDRRDPSDDWSFVDGPRGSPTTILGYIQLDAGRVFRSGISGELIDLGGIDRCDMLTDEVWGLITHDPHGNVIPMPPANQLNPRAKMANTGHLLRDLILDNTSLHAVYYFKLNAISHHLIIETNRGLARIHQAFIQAGVAPLDLGSGVEGEQFVLQGYTARDWATNTSSHRPQTPPHTLFSTACAKWGGGRDLTRDELAEFYDKLIELQTLAFDIAKAMEANLPPKIVEEEKAMFSQSSPGNLVEKPPRGEWFDLLKENPEYSTMTSTGDPYDGVSLVSHPRNFPPTAAWGPFKFDVPGELFGTFSELHAELTGCLPNASTLVSILGFGSQCFRLSGVHKGTGQPEALGWSYVAGSIPH